MTTISNPTWENNSIQFPRLLAEIRAIGLTEDQMKDLQESMDLDAAQIEELLERAETAFETFKMARTTPRLDTTELHRLYKEEQDIIHSEAAMSSVPSTVPVGEELDWIVTNYPPAIEIAKRIKALEGK